MLARALSSSWLCGGALLVLALAGASAANHGHMQQPGPRPSLVLSPLPHEYVDMSKLPASYDIRAMGGRSLATDNRNQHIPQVRGSPRAALTYTHCVVLPLETELLFQLLPLERRAPAPERLPPDWSLPNGAALVLQSAAPAVGCSSWLQQRPKR
jgi:hypothetical protein